MAEITIPGPAWIPGFLTALAASRSVDRAIEAAPVSRKAIYDQRRRNQRFDDAWKAALHTGDLFVPVDALPNSSDGKWQHHFLELLAQTSNIAASARTANVPLSTVYRMRRNDREFAAKWEHALYEGYTSLEMELLGYLRSPEADRKMDVANALRLLTAHRETVAREKARRGKRDRKEVLASLEAKLEKMRERRLQAEKLEARKAAAQQASSHGQ